MNLRVQNLTVGTLQEVNLRIDAGEVVCVSGASGSGKSRLLRAIADLEPHSGRVALGGEDRDALAAHAWRARVMLVPAESQWWADRVGEHFARPMSEGLAALGFPEDASGWAISRLSSGEKQRLALLRALSRDPAALLLDEPTANLDDGSTRRLEQWLLEQIAERGLAVIWVAHDAGQISRVARRHWRIDGAQLVSA